MPFFPISTHPYQRRLTERDWDHRGPSAFRKLAFSVLDMAVITGVLLRLGRALLLANGEWLSGITFVASFLVGALFLFTMATLHLGSFPLRHWKWRVPMFALLEAVTEVLMSFGLIALGREPYGSGSATYSDWPAIAISILTWRLLAIVAFAMALGSIVQWARLASLRKEHRL